HGWNPSSATLSRGRNVGPEPAGEGGDRPERAESTSLPLWCQSALLHPPRPPKLSDPPDFCDGRPDFTLTTTGCMGQTVRSRGLDRLSTLIHGSKTVGAGSLLSGGSSVGGVAPGWAGRLVESIPGPSEVESTRGNRGFGG